MELTLATIGGLVLDALLGEPRVGHPLVGFGRLAEALDRRLPRRRWAGGLAWLVLVAVPAVAGGVAVWVLPPLAGWLAATVVLWLCIAWHSLKAHTRAVETALQADDVVGARRAVACLVSRDTTPMDVAAIRRAALESLLENAGDGVHATLFWFAAGGLVVGPAGAVAAAVAHRAINTLDAMWGYRTPRYRRFGWTAARADDLANWPSARLTALSFVLVGNARWALRCWQQQAKALASPNAGPVMCAGAGAMGVRLGGGAYYHGVYRQRPAFGCGVYPGGGDIERAIALVGRTLVLWGVAIVLLDWLWR
ncbi:adenosylcobinamide-phosphate synthase CbiB [uncultured Salinisphaera sp.]|uniref:adenosylcobinamide-phosphate synthase CbiB n=1 Tax=uncultured Salinisphaera sp. TaxID=359372 RepID=UPI0032B24E1A